MTVNFQDSEKKITLPSEITFENGETLPTEDVQVSPVLDDDQNIIALNVIAELEEGGTVTNNITFHSFDEVCSDPGLYGEDAEDYEHPVDDCSYDTIVSLAEDTLYNVQVDFK